MDGGIRSKIIDGVFRHSDILPIGAVFVMGPLRVSEFNSLVDVCESDDPLWGFLPSIEFISSPEINQGHIHRSQITVGFVIADDELTDYLLHNPCSKYFQVRVLGIFDGCLQLGLVNPKSP